MEISQVLVKMLMVYVPSVEIVVDDDDGDDDVVGRVPVAVQA